MNYPIIKRIADISLALLTLPIVTPVILLFSVLSWINFSHPFFIQARPGLNNKTFFTYKITSMNSVGKNDSERINFYGSLIRKLSIDELPQIYNVLLGQMSFVGPRPLLEEYLEIDYFKNSTRANALPGITGLSQTTLEKNASLEDKIKMDEYYVANMSFLLDLRILIRTFPKVFRRPGNY